MKEEIISGVEIQLWFLGGGQHNPPRQMPVAEDGYVGELCEGAKFAIQAVVEKSAFVLGVHVDTGDEEKRVDLKKDIPPQERPFTETNGGHLWEQKVTVHQSRAEVACTWSNDNHLNLVEVVSGGFVRYWEIALISRDGEFFFTTQCLYEAQCYWDDESGDFDESGQQRGFNCPFFQKERFPAEEREWPQMVEFLEMYLDWQAFPPVRDYKPTPKPSAEDLGPKTGRVSWWSHSSGTGAILTLVDGVEAEVKVHWKAVRRLKKGLAYLVPDEIVDYAQLVPANREGVKETKFKYEATGVWPSDFNL